MYKILNYTYLIWVENVDINNKHRIRIFLIILIKDYDK